MRHRKSGRQLNRNSSHRTAMFRNMAVSLIEHEVIKTTLPKAKELRRVAEPLITLAKEDSVANRRLAFSRTRSKEAVGKLFTEIGPRYAERPGGYTRILKCGFRAGDAAPRGMRTACVFVIAPATWRRFVPTKVTDGASRDSVSSPDTRDVCLSGESAVSKLVTDAPSVGIRTSRFPRPIGVAEIKPPRGTEPREPSSPKSWGVACEPASAKDAASCSVSAKATRFTSSLSGRYASA